MEWMTTKDGVPLDNILVEVIILIKDHDPENFSRLEYRRLIATGYFDRSFGWRVSNGYIRVTIPDPSREYSPWDDVLYWRYISSETLRILNKWGFDREEHV